MPPARVAVDRWRCPWCSSPVAAMVRRRPRTCPSPTTMKSLEHWLHRRARVRQPPTAATSPPEAQLDVGTATKSVALAVPGDPRRLRLAHRLRRPGLPAPQGQGRRARDPRPTAGTTTSRSPPSWAGPAGPASRASPPSTNGGRRRRQRRRWRRSHRRQHPAGHPDRVRAQLRPGGGLRRRAARRLSCSRGASDARRERPGLRGPRLQLLGAHRAHRPAGHRRRGRRPRRSPPGRGRPGRGAAVQPRHRQHRHLAARRLRDRRPPAFQFTEAHTWIESLGIGWKVGVDGISLFMVALTGILFPIAILGADPHHDHKPYYAWLLLLRGRAASACSWRSTSSSSS